jgi:5-carboxymethyl-2-hydroxymuconate isomerase
MSGRKEEEKKKKKTPLCRVLNGKKQELNAKKTLLSFSS